MSRVEPLSTAVKRRRRELALKQRDLAELAGCSVRFVHMLEHTKDTLRLDKTLDVLRVLGLSLAVVPGDGQVVEERDRPVSRP